MFDQLGWSELAVIAVAALFIFGPERLPKAAADAGRMLRQLRQFTQGMRDDLRGEFPEVDDLDLTSMHPKTFVRKHLFDDDPSPDGTPQAQAGPSGGHRVLRAGERPPYDPEAT